MFSWIIKRVFRAQAPGMPLTMLPNDAARAYERGRQEAITMMFLSSYTGPK
jgi:hypothetical protein